MFKKQPKLGNYYIYSVYDNVSKQFRGTFYHSTDEDMIRTTLPTILMDFALRDIEIHKIASFDDTSGEIIPIKHVIIPTDCYTFPHSRLSSDGDDLPVEELDTKMKEFKAQKIAELSEQKSNNKGVVNE